MAQKQRAIRMESKSQLAAMQSLETKSDEELASETRYRSAAQAILGARAAERYDAQAARDHFSKALAAARPQERLQLRRMADASLALAERRAGDLKAATEKLGVQGPTNRQLWGLRLLGLVVPPKSAGIVARIRGILIAVAAVVAVLGVAFGIVYGIGQAAGGLSLDLSIFYALALVLIVIVGLVYFGRRRQKAAQLKRKDEAEARASGAR